MLCLCWRCRGSIGGKEGSKPELREKAGPDRLECPTLRTGPRRQGLGAAGAARPDQARAGGRAGLHPGRSVMGGRVPHTRLYPAKGRRV
ncbi:hypothetical protein KCH_77980 [Kitasatospora cheerisanensis KCTC 2395]|uniref:Uncharacterized protein n=1 Tax=Kitasatospora cheerisanensis KCTC 2395 TaxID=1348663 RepID=A0A066YQV0_9ACTN|nr:hypothetical protein KCH_77980 [Kitasatospora cheerisanensis KCTC 2395]